MNQRPLIFSLWLSSLLLVAGCGADVEEPTPTGPVSAPAPAAQRPSILFVGTSLTAGYGLAPEESYPARIQERIDAAGWDFEAVNAGVSGDTSSDGVSRLDWLMRRMPVVVVLELGANDGLRGMPVDLIERNLLAMVDRVRELGPEVPILLAGMQMPPNLGPDYIGAFREVFPRVAAQRNLALVPFLLEGVAADRDLNQPDGIHPNAAGQEKVAENVWPVLEPILRDLHESGRSEP